MITDNDFRAIATGLSRFEASMREMEDGVHNFQSGLQALRDVSNDIVRRYTEAAPLADHHITEAKAQKFAVDQMLSTEEARRLLRLAYMDDLGFGWMENPYAYWDGTWKEEYV